MELESTLLALEPGQTGRVLAVEVPGSMGRRLREIGLTPGTQVSCLGRSPLGDPSAYLVRGAVIALRAGDSGRIRLFPAEAAHG